ncbi:hypothetical protein C0Q70_05698 [Pomacea canaliculata]|uniref:Uncharacterized protein n=1 Tax=Pomacea canaliculata TaxID=400727 RepID=A0A2T7PLX0_POMCA|nr:hypothetical protein C0Q70_05698 [Pomacea canaliculata]
MGENTLDAWQGVRARDGTWGVGGTALCDDAVAATTRQSVVGADLHLYLLTALYSCCCWLEQLRRQCSLPAHVQPFSVHCDRRATARGALENCRRRPT